jgi:hypothetical protein
MTIDLLSDVLAIYGALHVLGWAADRVRVLREPGRFRRTGGTRAIGGGRSA